MNDKLALILMILVTIIIIISGIFIVNSTSPSVPSINSSSNAIAYTMDPTSFDWGSIDYDADIATKEFKIKNKGSDVLKLYNIKTSCHCTKAQIVVDGDESPFFGMSGISSWVGEVKPGKEARLIVKFDQRYHGPQGVGPINRFVSIETNDKGNQKITFTLTGIVVKK
ncbi:MAG: DUF1573 domain-containing protein [Patescibacteria group bacterium]